MATKKEEEEEDDYDYDYEVALKLGIRKISDFFEVKVIVEVEIAVIRENLI